MNERIKELAEQADLLGDFTPTKIDGRYVGYINVADIKKFAELIVQECADVCENSNYEFGKIFTKMIKQHFGVEE